MKTKNYLFYFVSSLLIIFFTSCDKFELDFTTDSQFNLDASSHELEIKTKQVGASINNIVLDGESFWVSCPNVDCGEMKVFEKFTVYYSKGDIKEIEGEWFNIKISPPYSHNVSILENDTNKERSLIIKMIWKSADNQVVINQKAGSGNENVLHASFAEAKEMSDLFMKWRFDNTKTKSGSEKKLKGTSKIKSVNKDLMYVFNYDDGFTIISASKGMYPILAYSETGTFSQDAGISGLATWIEFTKDDIEKSFITTKSNVSVSDKIRNYELLKEMFSNNDNELRSSSGRRPGNGDNVTCFNEIRGHVRVGPVLTTKWSQGDPWNRLAPTIDGERAPAGCVPIAIAQAVNYHKTLTTKNIDWNKISNNNGDEMARLVKTISDEVKMTYKKSYAHPNINIAGLDFFNYRDRVKNFLNRNGYDTKYVEPINASPMVYPSIIEGFTKNFIGTTNWLGGHWWVLDGYESYSIWNGCGVEAIRSTATNSLRVYSMLFFHFNWGWRGENDGWFGVGKSYLDYSKNLKKLNIIKE